MEDTVAIIEADQLQSTSGDGRRDVDASRTASEHSPAERLHHPGQRPMADVDDRTDPESTSPPAAQYGCCSWHPSRLQVLLHPRCFLLLICLAALGQSMAVNGLIGVTISTVERRFALPSSRSAWITGSYELAGVPALLVVGYLGSKVRRPVWIAAGMAIFVAGAFTYTIPHYVAAPYRYAGSSWKTNNLCSSGTWDLTNVSMADNSSTRSRVAARDCDGTPAFSSSVGDGGESGFLGLFIVAAMLMGVGAVPLYVLGVTYTDDSSPRGPAAFHIGVFYSMTVIGPVIAFICGGLLLKLYESFNTVDTSILLLKPSDPRWVGAWWIGFLVALAIVLPTIPLLLGFPADPPDKNVKKQKESGTQGDGYCSSDEEGSVGRDLELDLRVSGGWRGVLESIRSLFSNGVFVSTALYGTCDAMIINGFQTFGPKYFQQQFGLSSAAAGIAFGMTS